MSELDLEFKSYLNIDTRKVKTDDIFFYNTDKNIGKLYFYLLKQDDNNLSVKLDKTEATNYTSYLIITNPEGIESTLTGVLQETDQAAFLFVLPNELTNVVGFYNCKLYIAEGEKLLTSDLFQYEVKDSNNLTRNTFIYYYGTFDDTLTADLIKGQNKLVGKKGNKSITMSYTDKKVFFAYHNDFGDLDAIEDQNGFNYISDFTKESMVIDGILYNVYSLNEKATVESITYTFMFKTVQADILITNQSDVFIDTDLKALVIE